MGGRRGRKDGTRTQYRFDFEGTRTPFPPEHAALQAFGERLVTKYGEGVRVNEMVLTADEYLEMDRLNSALAAAHDRAFREYHQARIAAWREATQPLNGAGIMGDRSAIEWTDATWNPVTGCTPVSSGCDNCYALTLARGRLAARYTRQLPVVDTEENRADTFAVRLWQERLDQPLRWTRPRMVFVNSMSDLFHIDVPEDFTRRVFEVMLQAAHHTYQVLTKRPSRMRRFVERNLDLFCGGSVPRHIWMGTSVESQDVEHRVAQLRQVPAVTRFLSCEPLLGRLDLDLTGLDWVIGGGESGEARRPCDPDWARVLRDACEAAGVAFFWKQWGGRTPKAGGRLLDGIEHNGWPAEAAQGDVRTRRTGGGDGRW